MIKSRRGHKKLTICQNTRTDKVKMCSGHPHQQCPVYRMMCEVWGKKTTAMQCVRATMAEGAQCMTYNKRQLMTIKLTQ